MTGAIVTGPVALLGFGFLGDYGRGGSRDRRRMSVDTAGTGRSFRQSVGGCLRWGVRSALRQRRCLRAGRLGERRET